VAQAAQRNSAVQSKRRVERSKGVGGVRLKRSFVGHGDPVLLLQGRAPLLLAQRIAGIWHAQKIKMLFAARVAVCLRRIMSSFKA
jgi:hypothetical protein